MTRFKAFVLPFFLLFTLNLFAQEPPVITVSPEAYSKAVIRVSPFSGEKGAEVSSLLRRALNLHLIVLALEDKGLGSSLGKDHHLQGSVKLMGSQFYFEGILTDPSSEKRFSLQVEATKAHLLAGGLANKIVELLTKYPGVSLTKVALVRRSAGGDELILTDFLKQDFQVLRKGELVLFPKLSPTGRKLCYLLYEMGKYQLEIVNLSTGERQIHRLHGLASSPVWTPDEENLILTLEDKGEIGLYQFNLERGSLTLLQGGHGLRQAGSVSSDGTLLAYVATLRDKPQVFLINLKNKEIKRISLEAQQATSPRFSPKGNLLIYLKGQRTLVMQDLSNHRKREVPLPFAITDPSFSPTGDYLIFRVKGPKGGLYLLHLDSLLYQPYLAHPNLYYPDWGR